MTDSSKETADVLNQVLQEWGPRVNLQYNSKVLVSDGNVAKTIYAATEDIGDVSNLQGVTSKPLEDLQMDTYTHAVFGLSGEDPKFILEGLKWMIYALQPKGIAIITSIKVQSGQAEGEEGQFNLGLEERMLFQSKGKIGKLADVLEYAGFERGKIRSHGRTTEAGGKKTEAEVVLAMKWDQLTG
ncbi:hypothetical protein LTR37_012515 [Vermiconidia calcicola]|uniref:Uncharacterized protein n=1 Tax=Vermiconidia calcicola TaxID=1690605 RepID=A0ACC3MZ15_9PEZI|nr:hypothetical protein LTR37_012515 [Vermiconidia calcicola]